MVKPRILVVDDEESIRHILVNVIEWNGCEVREAATAEDGLALLSEFSPDVALLDIVMPGRSGLDLLKDIKQRSPDTEVVMMTSHASAETALRAIREGAFTYLQKPFENLDEIWTTLQRALEKRNLAFKKRDLVRVQEERTRKMASDLPLPVAGAAEEDASSFAELLNYFMDMVTDQLGVQDACILLVDENAGELWAACRRTDGTRNPTPARIPLTDGVCGAVARTGTPFIRSRPAGPAVAGEADLAPTTTLFGAPIALCVPIAADKKVLGVFAAGPRGGDEPFREADAAHLSALGAQLAVAIDGTRRATRLEKAYESLKAAQEQLVRSERLKAVGQLAAGVAHDFNNVLSVIVARAEMLNQGLRADPLNRDKAASDLGAIIKAGLQGVQVIKRIQNYTRIRKDMPTDPADLNDAVRDAVEITKPKWKQEAESNGLRIQVQLELSEVRTVAGNLLELTQVIENLIFNAVEAMPKGGTILFRTRMQDGTVLLEISDTGTGMDEQTQKRLFEPFFTTKESGQGLGTSIVFGIIARHRGSITVDSKPGSGTIFRISLPAHVPAKPAQHEKPVVPIPASRKARVLLVDDEEAVRTAYHEAIAAGGHEVISAASGEEAVELLEGGRFDAVVTDLSMGRMSGFQVARAVKMYDPSIRVVLLSGWVVEPKSEQVRRSGIDEVLLKPCRIEDLHGAIERALVAHVEDKN